MPAPSLSTTRPKVGRGMGDVTNGAAAGYRRRRRVVATTASLIALAVFALDLWSPLQGAVAVLYVIVILLIAQISTHRTVVLAGVGCAVLALFAFATEHMGNLVGSATVRFGVSLVAISAATMLSMRDRSARTTLAEQLARLLELSHDTVIICDGNDDIIYWNDGAQALYGWTRDEAVGQNCNQFLQTNYLMQDVRGALRQEGHWSGELTRTRRDGTQIVLASRRLLRRDPEGNAIGVIESSADVTEHKRAEAERQRSEQRYRDHFRWCCLCYVGGGLVRTPCLHMQEPSIGRKPDRLARRPSRNAADALHASMCATSTPLQSRCLTHRRARSCLATVRLPACRPDRRQSSPRFSLH